MIVIRLPKAEWGRAWRAMIDIGPVRLISKEPIYEVLPAHLELLNSLGLSYEIVPRKRPPLKRNHVASDHAAI